MRKLAQTLAMAAVIAAPAAITLAEGAMSKEDIADLMHERHESFEEIGDAFRTIREEIRRGSDADMALLKEAADEIHELSKEVDSWFPAGSGPETGNKTDAKAEIWQNRADFSAKAEQFVAASGEYAKAATTLEGARSGMLKLGGSCKSCHDSYKVDDD